MQKTEHYQLNQWEAEDAVKRTDFNEDNQKIDTAFATEASERKSAVAAEASARASAIAAAKQEAASALSAYKTTNDAALAALKKAVSTADFVIGSYTGNGTTGRTISVGFTPKFVIQLGYHDTVSAVTIATSAICRYMTKNGVFSNKNTTIVTNGFQTGITDSTLHNGSGNSETYIAFR